MPRPVVLALALAAGCASAFALASCGGGKDAKLLPGATAREITENLDAVERLASEGECIGATNEAQEVSAQVEALSGVDPKLKQALEAGAARLNEVVAECRETTETTEPSTGETTTEEERLSPGQEKKAEKEREKEEKNLEKEEEQREKREENEQAPPETTSAEPPTAPSEGGGTGAPGGVSPGEPVTPEGE